LPAFVGGASSRETGKERKAKIPRAASRELRPPEEGGGYGGRLLITANFQKEFIGRFLRTAAIHVLPAFVGGASSRETGKERKAKIP
jgi:hypothetical protein